MTDPLLLNRLPLKFTKGQRSVVPSSAITPEYAATLSNWAPDAFGSLVLREGWINGGAGGTLPAAAARRLLGLGYHSTGDFYVIAVDVNATQVDLYTTTGALGSLSYAALISATTVSPQGSHWAMAMGIDKMMLVSPSNAGYTTIDPAKSLWGAAPISLMHAVAFHKNRFFIGGGTFNSVNAPYRLVYSDLGGDPSLVSGWPVTNFIDVGQQDGGIIESLGPLGDDLLIGKSNGLWILSGSGPDNFTLRPIEGGGAWPGRTIEPTPYAACIWGPGGIYLYQGGDSVRLISRDVSDLFAASSPLVQELAFFDEQLHCFSSGTPPVVFDFETGAWHQEPVNTGTAADQPRVGMGMIRPSGKARLIAGPTGPSPSGNLLQYRPVRRDPTPVGDAYGTEVCTLTTATLALGDGSRPATLRYVDLLLWVMGSGGATVIDVSVTIDGGVTVAASASVPGGSVPVRRRVDFDTAGLTGFQFSLTFSISVSAPTQKRPNIDEVILLYSLEGGQA